jgi:diacylglycerol kinase family enzyme
VGRIIYNNSYHKKEERIFVSECQAGIGGAVVDGVQSAHKRLGGTLAFGSVALKKLFRYEGQNIYLQFDEDKKTNNKLIGIVIGNGVYCGGGMKLTPAAQLNDGLLDVLTIHDMSTMKRLLNFPKIYWGTHVDSPYFDIHRSRRIVIDSEEPMPLAADGEMLGTTSCEIKVLPAALKVKSCFKFKLTDKKKTTAKKVIS